MLHNIRTLDPPSPRPTRDELLAQTAEVRQSISANMHLALASREPQGEIGRAFHQGERGARQKVAARRSLEPRSTLVQSIFLFLEGRNPLSCMYLHPPLGEPLAYAGPRSGNLLNWSVSECYGWQSRCRRYEVDGGPARVGDDGCGGNGTRHQTRTTARPASAAATGRNCVKGLQ